jgi:hypothetical protein
MASVHWSLPYENCLLTSDIFRPTINTRDIVRIIGISVVDESWQHSINF